jgi:hypothetical protein
VIFQVFLLGPGRDIALALERIFAVRGPSEILEANSFSPSPRLGRPLAMLGVAA